MEININEQMDITRKKFDIIKDDLNLIKGLYAQLKKNEEKNAQERLDMIKCFENKVNLRFEEESERRKILENRLSVIIDGEYKDLKLKISQEIRTRMDNIEKLKNYTNRDIPSIKTFYPTESKIRKEEDENIKLKIKNECNNLKDKIINEKKIREDNEEGFLL